MSTYQISQKAVADLADIWNYTYKKRSERQADIYYNSIIEGFSFIENNPYCGKSYAIVASSLYVVIVGKYIIFYKIIGKQRIFIVRVLHQSMTLRGKL